MIKTLVWLTAWFLGQQFSQEDGRTEFSKEILGLDHSHEINMFAQILQKIWNCLKKTEFVWLRLHNMFISYTYFYHHDQFWNHTCLYHPLNYDSTYLGNRHWKSFMILSSKYKYCSVFVHIANGKSNLRNARTLNNVCVLPRKWNLTVNGLTGQQLNCEDSWGTL